MCGLARRMRSTGDNASLTPDDAKALEDVPNVATVVPERSGGKTLRLAVPIIQPVFRA